MVSTKFYLVMLSQCLEGTLLTYLNEWREWVMRKDDIPDESKMCVLPDQTIDMW